jgi:trk system potassium uptake protein TrkA
VNPGGAVFHVPVHVVVVGCGRVGSELAITLERDGHSVAVIDKDPRSLRRLPPEWTGRTVVGFGFDRDHLELAGIREAGAVAAVTSGDNSNILTARIARETYQIPNVVARIYDPRRAVIYQRLGIPTVATVTWTTEQVMRRLFPEAAVTEWTDTSGQLVLVERTLPDEWAGQRLDQINLEGRARLIAITRASTPRLTTRDAVGQEGDLLHIAARKDSLDELERRLLAGPEGTT